jgi:hypothetical protein
MGFFKKIFKGVGKVFKKIGKGIKKAFMKFGQFMDKAGILGQVAMLFIVPGIGAAISKSVGAFIGQTAAQATATAAGTQAAAAAAAQGASAAAASAAGAAATASATAALKAGTMVASKAATGLFAKGAASQALGHVLQFAGKAAMAPGKLFSSVTKGVTSTLTEFTKTAAAKMGVDVPTAAANFFGEGSALSRAGESFAAPFSAKAQASITAQKAEQLFSKEGLTFDLEKLTKVSEEVNTSSFLGGDIPGGMELYDGSQQVKVTPDASSPVYETGQFSDMPDYEQAMKTSTPVKEKSLFDTVVDPIKEKATDKLEALGDPKKVSKAVADTLSSYQRDRQEAAESYSLTGQTVEFGEFGAGSFQSAPLTTFQVNNIEPISNYAKQIQSMSADQLTPSLDPFGDLQLFNTGMTPRPVGGP